MNGSRLPQPPRAMGGAMGNSRLVGAGIIAFVVLVVLTQAFGSVPAGYRGVVLQFGATTGAVKQPGLYMIMPFAQHVVLVNCQIQAYHAQSVEAASADLQDVHTGVTVNWQINPEDVVYVVSVLQNDIVDRVLQPNIQESIKSSEARYTAEQLITARALVKKLADDTLAARVAPYHVNIVATAFTDFQFSPTFTEAIEAKVTAEQNALKEKNNLLAVQYRAQQRVAEAEGQAKALYLRRVQLNPLILTDEWIQKWDGKLPTYTGSGSPFIGLPQIQTGPAK